MTPEELRKFLPNYYNKKRYLRKQIFNFFKIYKLMKLNITVTFVCQDIAFLHIHLKLARRPCKIIVFFYCCLIITT